jgi:sugar O-acyltransferase (sialic acid O-acetyltransferase NeuD family)
MGKRNIGIIGNGVIGRQLEFFIRERHKGGEIEFTYFDDLMVADGKPSSFPLMGYSDPHFLNHEFYIGLGYKCRELKRSIADTLFRGNFHFPAVVHHSAYLHPTVEVGNGVLLFPMCNIGFDVKIGYGSIVNKSSTIAHDSEIGICTFLAPSVTFCGAVKVGDNCFIGAGTVVADKVRIGNNVTVGIGSVITRDIPDGLTVIGNPARVVSKLDIR